MKTLYFGGSFSPVGNHHLLISQFSMERGGYDRVVLIPCFDAAHKTESELLSFEHRYKMCRIATCWHGSPISVSDIEKRLWETTSRKSYTYETVMALKSQQGETDVHLLIGTDAANYLPNWYRAEELVKEVTFLVYPRSGCESLGWKSGEWHQRHKDHIKTVDIRLPQLDISSTLIRERIRSGMSIHYFVPRGVEEYISSNNLYSKFQKEGVIC